MLNKVKIFYSRDYFNDPLSFFTILFLIINSGFFIKHYFIICPIYISFYISLIVLTFLIFTRKNITIPQSFLIGLITIGYLVLTQIGPNVRIWSWLSAICTIAFYIIGIIFLQNLSFKQIICVSNAFLLYNFILYLADTLYRFALFKFNLINIFINFYEMKDSCFIFFFINALAINTTTLGMFAFYLYNKTKKNIYRLYCILFSILTLFSFSRAAILAIIMFIGLYYAFKSIKTIIQTKLKCFYQLPFQLFTIYFALLIALIISIPITIKIINFLMNDGSFGTKINIINEIFLFFNKASFSQIFYGIGFDNAEGFVGMYAHNYLATYIIETGIIGFSLVTLFLLRILYETPRTIYILFPFCIYGISYIGYSILNLFYVTLALMWYLEHYSKKDVADE